ncbi:hypothetical protein OSB04_011359 [Centaurea solstitialis]|uniref:Uncharacterized protein n=1 Tax=Centaurea solstitialis TaxID=347529 RepID=A0AA38WLF5_9ASTR|nr:hypothetical protein OSB04_011359 [Centaurea solstitialis]
MLQQLEFSYRFISSIPSPFPRCSHEFVLESTLRSSCSINALVHSSCLIPALSRTFKKEGMKLDWQWNFKPPETSKKMTSGMLDSLINAIILCRFGSYLQIVYYACSIEILKSSN